MLQLLLRINTIRNLFLTSRTSITLLLLLLLGTLQLPPTACCSTCRSCILACCCIRLLLLAKRAQRLLLLCRQVRYGCINEAVGCCDVEGRAWPEACQVICCHCLLHFALICCQPLLQACRIILCSAV